MNLLMRPGTASTIPSTPTSNINDSNNSIEQNDSNLISHNTVANEIVERSFHAFMAELFLYALPKTLMYYPRQQIIGCNVERLLSLLNGTSKAICSVLVETTAFVDLLRRHGVALELENAIVEE